MYGGGLYGTACDAKRDAVELKNKTVQAQMGIHAAQLGLLAVGETSNEEKA